MKDEDIKTLKDIGNKLNTQDNRSTAFPLFVVQSLKKQYVDRSWDWEHAERKEDWNSGDLCNKCQLKELHGKNLPKYCEDCDADLFVYYNEEYEFDLQAGVFLTEHACKEHIKYNGYHYHRPRIYAISAWRNDEMQSIMKILSVLASKDGKVSQAYL